MKGKEEDEEDENKREKNVENHKYLKTEIIWIPNNPSREEILKIDDFMNIQINEIIAINAIYGSITLHCGLNEKIKEQFEYQGEELKYSCGVEEGFSEKDEIENRVFFIPEAGEDKVFQEIQHSENFSYENSCLTIYSLVFSRNMSESMPFKNRRYWRRTDLFVRLTVFYSKRYPLDNPGLLFDFSLELPESIYTRLVEEVTEVIINRSGDQECIFQVINSLEAILDKLCEDLQISEDLWERMRRQNNQKEFEKHLDNSILMDDNLDEERVDGIEAIESMEDYKEKIKEHLNSTINFVDNNAPRQISEMGPGFLDDTILDYQLNNDKPFEYKDVSPSCTMNMFHLDEDVEFNSSLSFLSSRRFNQDFRIQNIIYSGKNVIITKSLHLIDQNNYQISVYKVPKEQFYKIQSKLSSLVMLQHRYMVRYYQCWVEKYRMNEIVPSESDSFQEQNDKDYFLLYMQSEYMDENKTLKDFFEKGKVNTRDHHIIWSLFRQILENLSYCHKNEVYHLNLSSNCIYVEEDIYGYTVKLSNFIFGTYLDFDDVNEHNYFKLPEIILETNKQGSKDGMIKSDIDNALRIFIMMWLKLKYRGLDYEKSVERLIAWLNTTEIVNDKSIFEMSQTVCESYDINFFNFTQEIPIDLKYIPKSALLILKKLFGDENNVNKAPTINDVITADIILRSDLLPNSIDKSEFQYYLSRICNPRTHESQITINTLFKTNMDRLNYIAFLMEIQNNEKISMIDLTFTDIVKTRMTKVLEDHDFVLWRSPILYPIQFLFEKGANLNNSNNSAEFDKILCECKYRTKKPYYLLDISNNLLCLPKSAPFSMICSLLSLLLGHESGSNNLPNGLDSRDMDVSGELLFGEEIGITEKNPINTVNQHSSPLMNLNTHSGTLNSKDYIGVFDSNSILETGGVIQRYVLFPIYEQPTKKDNEESLFGPPKSKLSLAFDIIYQFNDSSDEVISNSNSNVGVNSEIANKVNAAGNYEWFEEEHSGNLGLGGTNNLHRKEGHLEFSSVMGDKIMLQVEGLLLSLKLVIPWLEYLDKVPVVRITIPAMIEKIYNEVISKLGLSTRLKSFKEGDKEMEQSSQEKDNCAKSKKFGFLNEDGFLRDIFTKEYELEWVYDHHSGSYRLEGIYSNEFISKLYEFIYDNKAIKYYIAILGEVIGLLSESSEILNYKANTRVRFYLNPMMDYDRNLYDSTNLVYTINADSKGPERLIYSMGGCYAEKFNNLLLGFTEKNTVENCIGYNNCTGINCIMGEVSIEILINQVCERAKKYRSEFVNTGGSINGVSLFDLFQSNGNNNMNEFLGESFKKSADELGLRFNIASSGIKGTNNNETSACNNAKTAKNKEGNEYEGVTDYCSKDLLLEPILLLKSCYPRVLVMTQTKSLRPKVLSLVRRLWQNDIKSEYRLTLVQSLSSFLEKLKRETLIEFLVIIFFQNNNSSNNTTLNSEDDQTNRVFFNNEGKSMAVGESIKCRSVYYRIEQIAASYYSAAISSIGTLNANINTAIPTNAANNTINSTGETARTTANLSTKIPLSEATVSSSIAPTQSIQTGPCPGTAVSILDVGVSSSVKTIMESEEGVISHILTRKKKKR
ncbi:eIF2 kinase IF2K-D (incomplete catalytic triad) [Cryptosporidium felis]|nr:eIF2 kinase IF2K-D (incomplete catalytic triad) [Cryptosporidium felis]